MVANQKKPEVLRDVALDERVQADRNNNLAQIMPAQSIFVMGSTTSLFVK